MTQIGHLAFISTRNSVQFYQKQCTVQDYFVVYTS